MMAIAVPTFRSLRPADITLKSFSSSVENITSFAWQQALITHKLHAVFFDFQANTAYVQIETENVNPAGKPIMKDVSTKFSRARIKIPDSIIFSKFVIQGVDEMSDGKIKNAYFFIMSNGISQEISISFADKNYRLRGKPRYKTMTLNPFTARFITS